MKSILEIDGLSKSYETLYKDNTGKFGNESNAILYDLSFSIQGSKLNAIIGGNGAGKTTLFNIICGYLSPDKGEVRYTPTENRSYNLTKLKSWNTSNIGIGRMFQTPRIFKNLTILENMMIADDDKTGDNPFYSLLRFKKVKEAENKKIIKVQKVFKELFGEQSKFWEQRSFLAGELSYGEQRILSLARLFMNTNLNLILLDEPCAGVNAEIIKEIATILKKIVSNGKTVLLIEHNIEFVRATADFTYYLEGGKVSVSGVTSEVLDNVNVKENYLA